jgi:hypothetical protein
VERHADTPFHEPLWRPNNVANSTRQAEKRLLRILIAQVQNCRPYPIFEPDSDSSKISQTGCRSEHWFSKILQGLRHQCKIKIQRWNMGQLNNRTEIHSHSHDWNSISHQRTDSQRGHRHQTTVDPSTTDRPAQGSRNQ